MKLSFFIARRYFLSKKKKNFINVISIISMIVVAIGTMALIVALSVFNGLEGLLKNMYGQFDPEITIKPTYGKFFQPDSVLLHLHAMDDELEVVEVIEDNVLAKFKESQRVVILKGVSDNFIEESSLASSLVGGQFKLSEGDLHYALIGRGIQYDLSINLNEAYYSLELIYPKKLDPGVLNPSELFRTSFLLPGGVFAIEKYYDENFIFVPITVSRNLLGKEKNVTSLELYLKQPDQNIKALEKNLQSKLGSDYAVLREEELHQDLFKILKWEKLFVFITMAAIIGIASINIFFSLTMLVIEKKKDISVLFSLGATQRLIRNVFLSEGVIISFTGVFIGLILGLTICFIQQQFGIVGFGVSSAVMSSYPVKVEALDVVYSISTIFGITLLASLSPANKASRVFSTRGLQ